jgi:Flp pilus assembly protein TadG
MMVRAGAVALGRDRRGSVTVESALVFTFVLMPMMVLGIGFGLALTAWSQVNLVEQSVMYMVWNNPATATAAQISSFVQASYGAAKPAVTVNASTACYCIAPTGTRTAGTSVSCSGSCSNGQVLATYLQVTVAATQVLPMSVPLLDNPFVASASGTVRIQ